jgi:hypothetical protein
MPMKNIIRLVCVGAVLVMGLGMIGCASDKCCKHSMSDK